MVLLHFDAMRNFQRCVNSEFTEFHSLMKMQLISLELEIENIIGNCNVSYLRRIVGFDL